MFVRPINVKEQQEEVIFGSEGKWWIGKINMMEVVRRPYKPDKIQLVDETLREGEDTPDVYFTTDDKLKIVDKLEEVGVSEIEVGYVGAIDEHYKFTKILKEQGIKAKIASHNRTYTMENEWKEEIDRTIEAGADIINFVGYASEPLSSTTPWLSKKDTPRRIENCIKYAKDRGMFVALLLVDLTRTKLEWLVKCYEAAVNSGVDRVYVCDAFGNATPEAISFLVKFVRDLVGSDIQIALHCHNDLGLSMANTLEGIMSGADVVDVTVNGLGHNSGITSLEELATAMKILYGVETGIRLDKIYGLSKLVEELSDVKIFPNKPIVGDNLYRHQLDSHMASMLRGVWYSWDIIQPDVLGRKKYLEWAAGRLRRGKSGATMAKIQQMGLNATDEQFTEISDKIRELVERKRLLSEQEVEKIIHQILE